MKNLCFFVGLLCLCGPTLGQSTDSCSCAARLQALVQVAKDRYAGFEDKVNPQTRNPYRRLLQQLNQQAAKTPASACLPVLQKYIAFFRDDHFTIKLTQQNQDSAAPKPLRVAESAAQIQAYLAASARPLGPLEGTWRDTDNQYQVSVYRDKKNPGLFHGAVTGTKVEHWQPGFAKFTLQHVKEDVYEGVYYFRDFKPVSYQARLWKDVLKFAGWGGYWFRTKARFQEQAELDQMAAQVVQQNQVPNLSFRAINDQFGYIKLSSFQIPDSAFNAFLIDHRTIIAQTPHLIIDLRGNVGGCCSLETWGEFIKLIYTQPIVDAGATEKVAGKLVSYPGRTVHLDGPVALPAKVALLIDDRCASSAELLIEYARQSKKVTLFGKNTSGTMDYGTVKPYELPCGGYAGYVATVRSDWTLHGKIDETGYAPDVVIADNQVDWVRVVMDYYAGLALRPAKR